MAVTPLADFTAHLTLATAEVSGVERAAVARHAAAITAAAAASGPQLCLRSRGARRTVCGAFALELQRRAKLHNLLFKVLTLFGLGEREA